MSAPRFVSQPYESTKGSSKKLLWTVNVVTNGFIEHRRFDSAEEAQAFSDENQVEVAA
jgi:hypothetical protein